MKLLAEFHRRKGWEDTGFSSTAEWLAWRIGIRPGAARERVRTALALEELPLVSEAMRKGELSFTKECAPYCTSLPGWSGSELSALVGPGWIRARGLVEALGPGSSAWMGLE